jgi:hypothetical protein
MYKNNPPAGMGPGGRIFLSGMPRETVLQGSFKAPLRERFLAKRSDRGANCLSPQGEFLLPQRSEC